jgi:hypothetical protein
MRLRLVLGTELSAKNKIQATGSLAVPVLRYSLRTVNHSLQYCPKADVDRLLTVTLSRRLAELLAGVHYLINAAHAWFK